MVDYELKTTESIVGCTTDLAKRRLQKLVKGSTCLRLIPKTSSTVFVSYFIVESRHVGALERINGISERANLSPSMFARLVDETVYRKRRGSSGRAAQQKLFEK